MDERAAENLGKIIPVKEDAKPSPSDDVIDSVSFIII